MARYLSIWEAGAADPSRLKWNTSGTAAPTANDDASTGGYGIGSVWVWGRRVWVASSVATSAAEWEELSGSLVVDLSVSGAHTIDRADGETHDLTLTGNATFTLAGALASKATDLRIILRQDGTGSRTVTWPGTITWVGGSAPTLQTAANAVDTIGLLSLDGGTSWLGYHAESGGASDHGALTGLTDDDHPQYLLKSEAHGPLVVEEFTTDPPEPLWEEDGTDFIYGQVI